MTLLNGALVVGSNGKFGQVFAGKLARAGLSVTGLDLDPHQASPSPVAAYHQGSMTRLPQGVLDALGRADCIVLCVPEEAVLQGLAGLLAKVREDAVVVDILSVKAKVARLFRDIGRRVGYLSIHPLFPPMDDFTRFPMCAVPLFENRRSQAFLELLAGWGSEVTTLGAGEHDAAMAWVQATPHAALLAFGLALSRSKLPFELLWRLSTPIQRSMTALLFRVVLDEHVDSHWSIQRENEPAAGARSTLEASLREVSAIAEAGDARAFEDLCSSLRAMFGPATPELSLAATRLLKSPARIDSHDQPPDAFLEIE